MTILKIAYVSICPCYFEFSVFMNISTDFLLCDCVVMVTGVWTIAILVVLVCSIAETSIYIEDGHIVVIVSPISNYGIHIRYVRIGNVSHARHSGNKGMVNVVMSRCRLVCSNRKFAISQTIGVSHFA